MPFFLNQNLSYKPIYNFRKYKMEKTMSSIFSDEKLLKRLNAILLKSMRNLPLTEEEQLLYDKHLGSKIKKVKDLRKKQDDLNPKST